MRFVLILQKNSSMLFKRSSVRSFFMTEIGINRNRIIEFKLLFPAINQVSSLELNPPIRIVFLFRAREVFDVLSFWNKVP